MKKTNIKNLFWSPRDKTVFLVDAPGLISVASWQKGVTIVNGRTKET